MQIDRDKPTRQLPRAARHARPVIRAMLMTTALAWSIGASPPSASAAPVTPPTAAASSDTTRNSSNSGSAPPGRGRVLRFNPPSPTPRSTRARRP